MAGLRRIRNVTRFDHAGTLWSSSRRSGPARRSPTSGSPGSRYRTPTSVSIDGRAGCEDPRLPDARPVGGGGSDGHPDPQGRDVSEAQPIDEKETAMTDFTGPARRRRHESCRSPGGHARASHAEARCSQNRSRWETTSSSPPLPGSEGAGSGSAAAATTRRAADSGQVAAAGLRDARWP